MASGVWRWAKQVVLWLGLLLCIYALWRARGYVRDTVRGVELGTWAVVAVLLLGIWAISAVAWQRYLLAFTGQMPHWRVSLRQVGLLLAGKYVPGGVFGFLARLYDGSGASRERLLRAGLAEQLVSVTMATAMGGVFYLSAWSENLAWLLLVPMLPPMAVVGLKVLLRSAQVLPWLRRSAQVLVLPDERELLFAATLQLAQLSAWMGLILTLVHSLFGTYGFSAMGAGGSFFLAVAAGMVTVFAPGGIGVREAALITLMSPWFATGQAILLAALLRLLATSLDLVAGTVAAILGWQARHRGTP